MSDTIKRLFEILATIFGDGFSGLILFLSHDSQDNEE